VAISYEIDVVKGVVFLRYQGVPTFAAFEDVMLHVFLDRDYRVGFNFLTDRRGPPPDESYMRSVADFLRVHSADIMGSRWAMVVGTTVGLAMTQTLQGMLVGTPLTARAFEDVAAAEEWLVSE